MSEQYDLVLVNGRVIDPANGRDSVLDIAIRGGKIAAVGPGLSLTNAAQVVDVTGHIVAPGLIDMHVHMGADYWPGGLAADGHSFSSGVTTFVDAGSTGADNWREFRTKIVEKYKTRVLAFVNVVSRGMGGDWEQDPAFMDPTRAAAIVDQEPDVAVGIKVAHYWTYQPYDAKHGPWTNVDAGLEAARLCGKPLMVDFWPRPERPYEELIGAKMAPGDIHTHVFAQQFPIILEDGRVNPALEQAQERGVIFDVGHGGGSFWFRNAAPAVAQGFLPNSISTDLHTGNVANGLVTNSLNVMSKFMNMGLSIPQVIERATLAPAQEIGHPELGTLSIGSEADVAVLREETGEFGFIDCGRAKMLGKRRLICALTLRAGEVAFDPNGMTMPEWQQAPPSYWQCKQPGPSAT